MLPTTDSDGAAKILHLHPETIEARARDGIIPGCKPGKKWVFVVDDLVQWLRDETQRQQQQRQGSAQAGNPQRNPTPELP